MSRNKIFFAVMLLFAVGVQEVRPLDCFQCWYGETDGKPQEHRHNNEPGCKSVKTNDTTSVFLKPCPEPDDLCKFDYVTGKSEGKLAILWERRCAKGQVGCKTSELDKIHNVEDGKNTTCLCKEKACNGGIKNIASPTGPGGTLYFTLLTLSWALLLAYHHHF